MHGTKVLTTIVLTVVSFTLLMATYKIVSTPMTLIEPKTDTEAAPMQPTAPPTATVNTTPQLVIAVMATETIIVTPTYYRPDMFCKITDPPGTICKQPRPTSTIAPAVVSTATPYPFCSTAVPEGDFCEIPEPSAMAHEGNSP